MNSISSNLPVDDIQLKRSKTISILQNIKDIWINIKNKTDNALKEKRNNFIDLFCGIGGFHQVLQSLNKKCVLACDIDIHCRYIYNINYDINPHSDITTLNISDIPDFDILCAGFPCQAFSNAGNKKTFSDKRGLLFDEIIKIVKIKHPKFLFLENVKHILKVDKGCVIKYILTNLKKNGYNVQLIQMSPHDYGIPQQRERVYFICIRSDIYINDVKLLIDKQPNIDYNKYLIQYDLIEEKYKINDDILCILNAWQEMISIFEIGEKLSPVILTQEFYKKYTDDEFQKLKKWKQDYIIKNKSIYIKYKKEWDSWYIKNKLILTKRTIYGQLDWQVGYIKKNDSIFNYFIQIRQSGIRVKRANYFPTLVAISQIPIYGKEKRYITPRECANIQSFNKSFILHPDDKQSYKQLGNSVNCENVNNIIKSTLTQYNFLD
jgi:DNA (cytosine-5)-methyltransferase 1